MPYGVQSAAQDRIFAVVASSWTSSNRVSSSPSMDALTARPSSPSLSRSVPARSRGFGQPRPGRPRSTEAPAAARTGDAAVAPLELADAASLGAGEGPPLGAEGLELAGTRRSDVLRQFAAGSVDEATQRLNTSARPGCGRSRARVLMYRRARAGPAWEPAPFGDPQSIVNRSSALRTSCRRRVGRPRRRPRRRA